MATEAKRPDRLTAELAGPERIKRLTRSRECIDRAIRLDPFNASHYIERCLTLIQLIREARLAVHEASEAELTTLVVTTTGGRDTEKIETLAQLAEEACLQGTVLDSLDSFSCYERRLGLGTAVYQQIVQRNEDRLASDLGDVLARMAIAIGHYGQGMHEECLSIAGSVIDSNPVSLAVTRLNSLAKNVSPAAVILCRCVCWPA